MMHSKTKKQMVLVHLFGSTKQAEVALRKEVGKVVKLGKLDSYRWTRYMGSYDTTDKVRVYFMTVSKFKVWRKINVYDDVTTDPISVKGDG